MSQNPKHPYGRGDTKWFSHDRFGMFIHWGLYSQAARHEWVQNQEQITSEDYQRYFNTFDPDLYEPKAWARAAKAAGMKYFVITTKHHEGFCLWDSKFTEYKATNCPAGRDLIRPMVEAFRAEGLKVGFYYSLIDWHHPHFTIDRNHPLRSHADKDKMNEGRDMSIYAKYMRDQVRELLTDFGKIDILWFDFSYPGENGKGKDDWESEKLIKVVRECQPDIIVDNRLDLPGSGDIETPEQFQPEKGYFDEDGNPVAWEACQTFSGSWGYHRDESTWKSPDLVLRMLIDGVSKGGNLLMNVGPTGRGEFDYRALDRLASLGEWMHVNERSIYGCSIAPAEFVAPKGCRYTYNAETKRLYLHLFEWPFQFLSIPKLQGKAKYFQFLHDASELLTKENARGAWQRLQTSEGDVTLVLPAVKPKVEIPVIEIFLADK